MSRNLWNAEKLGVLLKQSLSKETKPISFISISNIKVAVTREEKSLVSYYWAVRKSQFLQFAQERCGLISWTATNVWPICWPCTTKFLIMWYIVWYLMLKDPKQQKIKCSIFYYKAILPTSLEETLCYSPLPHHLGKATASNMLLPHEVFYF